MNILGKIVRTSFYCRTQLIASSSRTVPSAAVSIQYVRYSSKSTKPTAGAVEPGEGSAAAAAKKSKTAPKITLVGSDQSVSIVNLDEAQRISKRRDLKLVKIVDLDMKSQRPVYKLMTSAEYLEEDLKRREDKKRNKQEAAIKGDKLMNVSARITEHDLLSKIHHVQKWLTKHYEVRVVVSSDGDKSKQEAVASAFESHTKGVGRIVQKRLRDNDLRFQILPVLSSSNAAPLSATATAPTGSSKKSDQGGKQQHPPGGDHQQPGDENIRSNGSDRGRRLSGNYHQLVKPIGFIGLFLVAKYTFWSYVWHRGGDPSTKR